MVALLWGFAEATLFFIVPDLWTSIAGRRDLKRGMITCLVATLGAVIGGTIMYQWGRVDLLTASTWVGKIPAISPAMIERVQSELNDNGLWALFTGPLRVTPYKLYAIHAYSAHLGWAGFLFVSAGSRFLRFAIVTIACNGCLCLVARAGIRTNRIYLLLAGWTVFYLLYFTAMPN